MKVIRCDRCGKIDDAAIMVIIIRELYYANSDIERGDAIDLCGDCKAKLDTLIREFVGVKGEA